MQLRGGRAGHRASGGIGRSIDGPSTRAAHGSAERPPQDVIEQVRAELGGVRRAAVDLSDPAGGLLAERAEKSRAVAPPDCPRAVASNGLADETIRLSTEPAAPVPTEPCCRECGPRAAATSVRSSLSGKVASPGVRSTLQPIRPAGVRRRLRETSSRKDGGDGRLIRLVSDADVRGLRRQAAAVSRHANATTGGRGGGAGMRASGRRSTWQR